MLTTRFVSRVKYLQLDRGQRQFIQTGTKYSSCFVWFIHLFKIISGTFFVQAWGHWGTKGNKSAHTAACLPVKASNIHSLRPEAHICCPKRSPASRMVTQWCFPLLASQPATASEKLELEVVKLEKAERPRVCGSIFHTSKCRSSDSCAVTASVGRSASF